MLKCVVNKIHTKITHQTVTGITALTITGSLPNTSSPINDNKNLYSTNDKCCLTFAHNHASDFIINWQMLFNM